MQQAFLRSWRLTSTSGGGAPMPPFRRSIAPATTFESGSGGGQARSQPSNKRMKLAARPVLSHWKFRLARRSLCADR
jgi:hypothetical protein